MLPVEGQPGQAGSAGKKGPIAAFSAVSLPSCRCLAKDQAGDPLPRTAYPRGFLGVSLLISKSCWTGPAWGLK